METGMKVNTFAAGDVNNLEMRIAAASVAIRAAADTEIRVEAWNLQDDRYTCELRSGTLEIDYKMKGVMHLHRLACEEARIVVYLPAKLMLEQVALEIGAGEMCMDAVPVSCTKMKVEVGAGKWKAAQLSVSDSLSVEIGAGKAKMKGVTAGRVHIECGVGSCAYKGRINGDIRVSCGVGSCIFQLENKESDFNYDISCAVGSISINGSKMKSFSMNKSHNNETALGTAVLECGLGSIEMKTNDIEIKSVK